MDSLPADLERVTGAVLGCAFQVANHFGHGFLEAVYRKAMVIELRARNVAVEEEVAFPLTYRREPVGTYIADLVVENSVVVELKAIHQLTASDVGQLVNYLKASRLTIGLLINFGRPRIEYKRVIHPSIRVHPRPSVSQ